MAGVIAGSRVVSASASNSGARTPAASSGMAFFSSGCRITTEALKMGGQVLLGD